jgi:hypothetical protein
VATLSAVRTSIWAQLVTSLTAVRYAPEFPTEQLPVYPAMVVYVAGADFNMEMGATGKIGLARVNVDIHVSRAQGLHRAIEELQPFFEEVPNALMAALSAGTFTQRFTFGQIDAEMLEGEWAADKTMFIRFVINGVKVRNSVA